VILEDEEGIGHAATPQSDGAERQSLFADIESLIDDGRTLISAELAFQKTRIAYTGSRARTVVLCGISAAVLVVFSVFALIVGFIIALAPVLTALGATAVVVGILLFAAAICVTVALGNIQKIRTAFRKDEA
jgi:hypothetical protein